MSFYADNISFLLAARDYDWMHVVCVVSGWGEKAEVRIEVLSDQLRGFGDWLNGLSSAGASKCQFFLRDVMNKGNGLVFSASQLGASETIELEVEEACVGGTSSLTEKTVIYLDRACLENLGRGLHALSIAPEGARVVDDVCFSGEQGSWRFSGLDVGVWGPGVKLDLRGSDARELLVPASVDGAPVVSVDVSASRVEVVDASEASHLKWLNVAGSGVKELRCPASGSLVCLDCSANPIASLDLGAQSGLEVLQTSECCLGELDLSKAVILRWVGVSGNKLGELDLAGCTALEVLDCSRNEIAALGLGASADLRRLVCADNHLQRLVIPAREALTYLDCSRNSIMELDLEGAFDLRTLNCSDNELVEIGLADLPALRELYCFGNNLADEQDVEDYLIRHGVRGQVSPQGNY